MSLAQVSERLKDRWRLVRPQILSGMASFFIRGLRATWRITHVNAEASEGLRARIVAGWHGRSMAFIVANKGSGMHLFVSPSRDGEMLSRVAESYGFRMVRGSTGREGARAAVAAIRLLRDEGGTLALTPDGPRGPAEQVQEGVITIAQKTGAPIVAATASARPARFLEGSWDRALIPLPFARVWVVWDDPLVLPEGISTAEACELVRQRVTAIDEKADRIAGIRT